MKKTIVTVVILTIVLALSGCNQSSKSADDATVIQSEEQKPAIPFDLPEAKIYLNEELGYGKFRLCEGEQHSYDAWIAFGNSGSYSKVILYVYPDTESIFAISVISTNEGTVTDDVEYILYHSIYRGAQLNGYTQYGQWLENGQDLYHSNTLIIQDAPFTTADLDINLKSKQDILADPGRRDQFWELYRTGQLQELYDLVKTYIDEEKPHEWDYAYTFLNILESVNGHMNDFEIVFREDGWRILDKRVVQLTSDIHFLPYVEIQTGSSFYNQKYVYLEIWAEYGDFWTSAGLRLNGTMYLFNDLDDAEVESDIPEAHVYGKRFLMEHNYDGPESVTFVGIELGEYETAHLVFSSVRGDNIVEYPVTEREISAYQSLYELRHLQDIRLYYNEYLNGIVPIMD